MNYAEKKIIKTNQEFFTVMTFANILGVDPSTVRRYITDGKLNGVKASGIYIIFLGDALHYVNNLINSDYE